MTMNAELADFYSTPGTNEDLEKQASVENFAKLAAKHGIDLSAMDDNEVNALYAEVYPHFAKTAEEKKKDEDEDEDEEKKESAAGHFQEKRAFQEKFAEADFMGRVMAHSFTQEMGNIEKEGMSKVELGMRARALPGQVGRALKGAGRKLKDVATGKEMREGMAGHKATKSELGKRMATEMGGSKERGEAALKLYRSDAKSKALKGAAKTTALYGGGAAAVGGGAALASKKKEKKASAQHFEELAANHAIKVASASGYDDDQAFDLVNAIYTLGLEETEKVAHVSDIDDAIHVRGLEYLESAGYPVDWSEVFGD
jgi:hypothetical protein